MPMARVTLLASALSWSQVAASNQLFFCPCDESQDNQKWDFKEVTEAGQPYLQVESMSQDGGCVDSFNCNYLDKPLIWYPCENPGGVFWLNQLWKSEDSHMKCSSSSGVEQCLDGTDEQIGTDNNVALQDCKSDRANMQEWFLNGGTGQLQLKQNSAVCVTRCDQYQPCAQCCSKGCGEPWPVGPPASGGSPGAGDYFPIFGFLVLLLLFLGVIIYVIGGIIYNVKVRQIQFGKDAMPNVEFWLMFPIWVKDGAVYAFRQTKAFCGWVYDKIQEKRGK